MSKLNLEVNLNELGMAQREALAAFILAPAKYEDHSNDRTQDVKEEYGMAVSSKELEEQAEVQAPKRTRAKRTTSTTSDALADKERTESIVDEYNNSKETNAVFTDRELDTARAILEDAAKVINAPETVEPEVVEPEVVEPEEVEVTLDDLRALVTPLVLDNYRAELKAKIVELGGTKLADMPTENYGALKTYLKGLK